ncbi:hypothetical protein SESBI_30316 [Sesbania bispinosa]|nr:hypothetical protein SESBI_30316 [Sesbania bispinosa]
MVETHEAVCASLLRHLPWCEERSVRAVRRSSSSSRTLRRIRVECFGDAPIGMWVDGEMVDLQHSRFEDCHYYEEEIEELKRKVTKLRRKLAHERFKVKATVACLIFTLVITVGVSVYAMMNFEGMKKSV